MTTTDPVLLSWIGREAVYVATEEVGAASIRYFAFATGDPNPIYRDEKFAARTCFKEIIAPPTMVCETNQFTGEIENSDGYIGHHWDLPLNGGRFMRGSNDYTFYQPVRSSDRITVRWKIVDIYERETRTSGKLVFVESEARYCNQKGELLALNRETNIYNP
jgi:acyl dehydratase